MNATCKIVVVCVIMFLEFGILARGDIGDKTSEVLTSLDESGPSDQNPYEWDSSESVAGGNESTNSQIPVNLTDKAFLLTKRPETYQSAGKSLKGHDFLAIQGKRYIGQCVFECLKYGRCQSVNLDHITMSCELSNGTHNEYPRDVIDNKSREYHTKGAYSVEKAALGQCAGDPCNGRGRCLETRSTTGGMAALCMCDAGWTGFSCNVSDPGPGWSSWTEWSVCSVTCSRGWRARTRECRDKDDSQTVNPTLCLGTNQEYEVCELDTCPVWKPWEPWGDCSTRSTCGPGVKVRKRSCGNNGTVGMDRYCLGFPEETTSCEGVTCNGLIRLTGGVSRGEGRLEVYDDIRERWVFICANQMTGFIADLACRQIGWPGGHTAVTDGRFGSKSGLFPITEINCTGTETYLTACEHSSWTDSSGCTDRTSLQGAVQCNVNGAWSLWSEWSGCSVSCENGTQTRTRSCDHPPPMYAGKQCRGDKLQRKLCTLPMCPVDGAWNSWSAWSECTVTCSWGKQWRNRTCNGPFYSGAPCAGADNETQACNPRPCPVDGEWKEWGTWSECSLTCGGGTRSRARDCNLGLHGGKNCTGDKTETISCNDLHCPVDGVWASWSAWAVCSLTCGNGTQLRTRSCEGPFYGGKNCSGESEDDQSCNTQPCPVDGIFSSWSGWNSCTLTCGSGSQVRKRSCIGPFYGGQDCQGVFNETQKCNEQPCPINGVYGEWNGWSACTLSCGSGSQVRNRTCTPPKYGGQNCQGPSQMTQECNTQPCPVDGVWLEWSPWSACNATCGGGYQVKTRKCQEPKYGGKPCVGVSSEYLTCGETSCEIPGEWFPWHPWSSCTVTCGGGMRHRQRECDMNSYKELTAPCLGNKEETVTCHTFACLPLAHTCTELGERGLIEDANCDIDPDGPGADNLEPLVVFCDMTSHNGVGVTVIGHDQETRKKVQGWEGAQEYEAELMYNASFDHVLSIVDQSRFCEQYISWECFAALIHNHNDNNKVTTGWLNRTHGVADYFGGAKPGSNSCACGMNHSCFDSLMVCNCDSNDETWRRDDGFLTYKDDLPVYAFVAGDTGGQDEEGYSQVGPIRCYGHADSSH